MNRQSSSSSSEGEIQNQAEAANSSSTDPDCISFFPPHPKEPIIKIENLHKTYLIGTQGVAALRGISVSVDKGEFVCILGTSGSGKTTLLNVMGTIDKPTKGHVTICGLSIKPNTKDSLLACLRLNKVAFVFQTFNLVSSMTALENVELPMLLKGQLSRSEISKRALDLLQKVGLGDRVAHFPNQLSGGEQQRVTIARSLSNDPQILLLDEPTGDLDTQNTSMVIRTLLDLHREGKTLIMVTHDEGLRNYANKVVRMLDGKVLKVEEINEQEREQAKATLLSNEPQLRTGVNTVLARNTPKTMYRKPSDYPCLRSD